MEVKGKEHQKPVIEIENLTIGYDENIVQRDLNFPIYKGNIFAFMGGSGCGKTTLMRNMIGLAEPIEGKVFYKGKDFIGASEEEKQQMKRLFGVLYQGGALWTSLTLSENVEILLGQFTNLKPKEREEVARLKLALVGLNGFEDFYPSEISGGMKKRAGLARAMALDPEILFFDEPSAGLDPITSQRLDELIIQLRDSLGTTIVLVTHELPTIFSIVDRAVFLDPIQKTMLAIGTPKELLNSENPQIHEFLTRAGTQVF